MITSQLYKYGNRIYHPNTTILSFVSRKLKVGYKTLIMKKCSINKEVTIGMHTFIGELTRIEFVASIGNYCSISHGVKLGLGPHPHDWISTSPIFYSPYRGYVGRKKYSEVKEKGKTIIEHDVLIGANAIVLAGVKIGTGAIIGAGSVVTKDIPAFAIAAGNPTKILKYRFESTTISIILESRWWNKNITKLEPMLEYANDPLFFINQLTKHE